MKKNRLNIQINRPAKEIFEFTLNPNNTPLWINSIVKEKINQKPTKLGTIYKNLNKVGIWSEYKVTGFKKMKCLSLHQKIISIMLDID